MTIRYAKVPAVDGAILYDLFDKVGWILPRSRKPARHAKIDGISNHTVYLDSPEECGFLERTFASSASVHVASEGERIVGTVRMISDFHQRSVLYDLIVDPDFQGRGIGRTLVQRCLEEFSHTQITLGTATATMPFYERLGFVQSGNYLELATEAY